MVSVAVGVSVCRHRFTETTCQWLFPESAETMCWQGREEKSVRGCEGSGKDRNHTKQEKSQRGEKGQTRDSRLSEK